MAPPTILAHKSAFLTAQTRRLSLNLAPSAAWHGANEDTDNGAALPDRAVDDALYRLNHALQQHFRRVYPPQATRHVAEQIDSLFLDAAEGGGDVGAAGNDENPGQAMDTELRLGVDLTTDEAVASLPAAWDAHRPDEAEAQPLEARQYAELQNSLTSLVARRAEARAQVERLRRMQSLLAPFGDNMQENLVTRNGAVEKELERMRFLLVRVAARMEQLPGEAAESQDHADAVLEDLGELEREKVKSLLAEL